MADDKKLGMPWQDDELDLIVTDYFAMLSADLAEQPYVKSRHSAAERVNEFETGGERV